MLVKRNEMRVTCEHESKQENYEEKKMTEKNCKF